MVNLGKMNVSVFGSYLIFRKSSGYGFCENFGNQTTSGFGFFLGQNQIKEPQIQVLSKKS